MCSPRAVFSTFLVCNGLNLRTRIRQCFIKTLWRKIERKRERRGLWRDNRKTKKKCVQKTTVVLRRTGMRNQHIEPLFTLFILSIFQNASARSALALLWHRYNTCSDRGTNRAHRCNAELIVISRCLVALNSNRLRRQYIRNCVQYFAT